jgi:hypothetical protein
MEIYGNLIRKICTIAILSLSIFAPASSQEYAVNAYDDDYEGIPKPIKTVFIDLETKEINASITIADNGYLLNKKPVEVNRGQSIYYVCVVFQGCYCKNSIVGERRTKIVIIDPETNEVVFDHHDSNMLINTITQLDDNLIFVSGEIISPTRRSINGEYDLGQGYQLRLRNVFPPDSIPHLYQNLRSFRFYEPIDESLNLYSSTIGDRRFILKTDHHRNDLIDSLEVDNIPDRSIIFAARDSLLYVFHQNYEYYGKFTKKSRDVNWIQSHLLIYLHRDFTLVDSLYIPDYPEGDYIIGDFDVADNVGPYIVYYFAQPGGLEDYTPAMLFIFDTRTNEASWLRVGWR